MSASEDGTLLVFDVRTGEALGSARFVLDHAEHLAVVRDGERAIVVAETRRGQRVRFALSAGIIRW